MGSYAEEVEIMNVKGNNEKRNYKDIIHLPHHVSKKRPQMPLEDRAAQFAPFSAVVGHEASVKEAARLTDAKRDLDEAQKAVINEILNEIQMLLDSQPSRKCEVEIEYFQADDLKSGGQYIVVRGFVKKIDIYTRSILLKNGCLVSIDDVFKIWIL